MAEIPEVPAPDHWRRCNSCKKPIAYGGSYWVCNVSTCNRKRTGLVFCSVSCWDAHVPLMNHRDSWAEERTSPTQAEWAKEVAENTAPERSSENTPTVEPKGSHAKAPT